MAAAAAVVVWDVVGMVAAGTETPVPVLWIVVVDRRHLIVTVRPGLGENRQKNKQTNKQTY